MSRRPNRRVNLLPYLPAIMFTGILALGAAYQLIRG